MPAALEAGQVDAISAVEPFVSQALGAGARKIAEPFSETEEGMQLAVRFTTEEFVQNNPDTLKGVRRYGSSPRTSALTATASWRSRRCPPPDSSGPLATPRLAIAIQPTVEPNVGSGALSAGRGVAVVGLLAPAAILAVDPSGWAPFGPVKWAVVSALGLAAVAMALATSPTLRLHRWSTGLFAGLVVWLGAAAVFGVDRIYSWAGTPERHLGVAAWALFLGLFVTGQCLRHRSQVRWVLDGLVVAALGVGAWIVLELAGRPPVGLDLDSSRLTGPLGSAALLGAACTLLVPATLGVALDQTRHRRWRAAAAVGSASAVAAAAGSGARAAWLGLAAAAVVVAVARHGSVTRRLHSPVGALVVAVGVAIGVLAVLAGPIGGRLADVADLDNGVAASRLAEWAVASRVLADDPVIGVGLEGYRIAAPAHIDAGYERRFGRQELPDRAHDGVLDVAVAGGIPAGVTYVALLAVVGGLAVAAVRRGEVWLVGCGAALIAYGVQQLMLFPVATLDPVAWLLAGVVVASTAGDRTFATFTAPFAVVGVVAALAVGAAVVGALDVAADRSAATALGAAARGDLDEAGRQARRATRLRPDAVRYHLVGSEVASVGGRLDGLTAALEHVTDALAVSRRDPVALARRAELLLGVATVTFAPDDLSAARAAWEEVAAGDPNNADHRLQLGLAAVRQGDVEAAEAAWLRAEALSDGEAAPSVNLARLYLSTGREAEALAAAERAVARDPDDPAAAQVLRRAAAPRR